MIEYMPWYQPGSDLMRCGGDDGCGALVVEGDLELHSKFHRGIERTERAASRPPSVPRVERSWG